MTALTIETSSPTSTITTFETMESLRTPPSSPQAPYEQDVDIEWEEWDPSRTPNFLHHCLAGSLAGISEHTLMYPLDTIKTHMQCASCPHRLRGSALAVDTSIYGTLKTLVGPNAVHPARLWRGVTTMLVGCAPAHALYFSAYEACRSASSSQRERYPFLADAVVGVASALVHDSIMTPLDTVKQRLQLGYYSGVRDCVVSMWRTEGTAAFYRSYPTTLAMNVPYGAAMVATNEFLRDAIMEHTGKSTLDVPTTLAAGTGAGLAAAAITTPLDCVKTRLQTRSAASAAARPAAPRVDFSGPGGLQVARGMHSGKGSCPSGGIRGPACEPVADGFGEAFREIIRADGPRGLFRGIVPRLMTHAPAVAVSWTTYEIVKDYLQENF